MIDEDRRLHAYGERFFNGLLEQGRGEGVILRSIFAVYPVGGVLPAGRGPSPAEPPTLRGYRAVADEALTFTGDWA